MPCGSSVPALISAHYASCRSQYQGFKTRWEHRQYSSFSIFNHAGVPGSYCLVQPLVFLLEPLSRVAMLHWLAGVVGVLFILNLLIGLYNDPT